MIMMVTMMITRPRRTHPLPLLRATQTMRLRAPFSGAQEVPVMSVSGGIVPVYRYVGCPT